ncbi:copper chaperone PCu(A)C [Streptacidiphilus monticola]|uniref:Copper chaperone PCu(A)C n=1 Tax=Streptacidiphilus monticola TaxID=2161674 RepID=A0ABW1GAP3_9ACTN
MASAEGHGPEDEERELAELEALAAAPAPRARVLTRRRLLLLQAPLLLLLALVLLLWGRSAPSEAGAAAPAKVGMRDPYLTPPASGSTAGPVYAYVTIRNSGGTADRLVSVSTPWAGSVSLQDAKGVAQPWITVPADGSVDLRPGGYRIALTQLKRVPKLHDTIQLDLSFAESGTVHVWAPVGPADSLTVEDVMHAMKYMDRLPPE